MARPFTIGELAGRAEVPVSTLRCYERISLLRPDQRTAGNYRAYGEPALARLRFIRSAQGTGLSLSDVARLLDVDRPKSPPCDEVLPLLRNRLAEVRGKIAELRRLERSLEGAATRCCDGASPNLCDEAMQVPRPPKKSSARRP